MMNREDEKIEMQGDIAVFCLQAQTVPSIFPYVQSKQAGQAQYQPSKVSEWKRGRDRETDEGVMQIDRAFTFWCAWWSNLSIISKTWSWYKCPYQLDMMTKMLWVDKFPWLCTVQVYLALQPLDIINFTNTFRLCWLMEYCSDSVL